MANKKYKLTDGNMWATDGIHDFGQNKTQRTINSEVNSALGGKAPTNHASTATTYGAASTSNYGHVKLSNTTPSMDGTAAVGDSTDVARANHVHPSDTSRVPTTRKINGMDLSQDRTLTSENIGYNSSTTYSSGTVGKAVSDLNGAITSDPSNRLKGKKIAIYADSWGNPSYGSLGKDYLANLTGETVHISWMGSQTMAQIYTNCWDSYNADIYIINGGLNDFGNNVTITAYKTAINNFVTAIRTVNPNSEIYFITPEFIRTSDQYTHRYPLEAYRAAIWGLKNLYKYNVVNSLKWVNISYQSDNVHPLATDSDLIGSYIAHALINYGDEETHVTEFTTLGNLKSTQLILYMIEGSPYLYFQEFSATSDNTDRYKVDITAFSPDIGFFQLAAMNGRTGDPAIVFHIIGDSNYISVYSKGVGTGNEIFVNGLLVPTYFRPLTMPTSF